MISKQDLQREYQEQNKKELERFNKHKLFCAEQSRDAAIYGLVGGVLLGYGTAKMYHSQYLLSQSQEAAVQEVSHASANRTAAVFTLRTLALPKKVNLKKSMFLNRRLSGIGMVIGGFGTICSYFYSRYTYTNCRLISSQCFVILGIEVFVDTMQKVAEKRHENYYNQLVYDGNPKPSV